MLPETCCFIGANKTPEQFGTVVHLLNSPEMWYTFKQQILLHLDGERVKRKKTPVLMILLYLNNITNNFAQNCLKVTHVNLLCRITVRSSFWSSTEINRQQGLVKKRKQIGSFALSLINNAVLNTRVVMSLMSFMFCILPFSNVFTLDYSMLFYWKKHAEYDSILPSQEKVNYFLCLDACDRTVCKHSPLPH